MWALAVVWCVRTHTLITRLGEVPDLTDVRWDLAPVGAPGLVVVVPARDEAKTIRPAMETLLAQDYPWLRILAVDDRSTDSTGAILDELAAARPECLAVLHLTEAPEGWIAKTFALESAAARSQSEWLLFTDADVWFSPSLLRRALSFAEITRADHLVIAPSPVIRGWGESMLLGFLSVMALWATRPWRVADPNAKRDAVGAGAFNLVRREVFEELGGLAPQRLAVVEDVTLGLRVRAAGYRQQLVFAPGLLLVHWATGARGIIRGLTKNLFAVMYFRLLLMAGAMGALAAIFLLPLLGLAWWRTLLPSLLILACIGTGYRVMGELTGIGARWAWLYPLGALSLLWAMLRSAVITLWRGGVRWRDTFYPLRELRQHNNPFAWEWEAAKARAAQRKAERSARPPRLLRTVRAAKPRPAQKPKPGRGRNDAPRNRPE